MTSSMCLFGDSVGKGVIFDALQNRYRFVADNFAKLFSLSYNIGVENYAAFGCTVTKGMKLIRRHEAQLAGSGCVLLEFGGNDCDFDWAKVSAQPELDHQPKTPMTQFRETYLEILTKVRAEGAKPVLMNLPPIDPDRYFARISAGLSPKNILHFLGDVDRIYRWHEYYSSAVCRLAAETGTPLIDVRSAFLTRRSCFDLLCEDGIHPNAAGHALISQVIGQYADHLI